MKTIQNVVLVVAVGGVVGLLAWSVWKPAAEATTTTAAMTPSQAVAVPQPTSQPEHPEDHFHPELDAVERMSVDELKKAIDDGRVLVIDVRDADSYLAGHIKGAWQIPYSRIAGEVPYLPRDRQIVTYCT